MKKILQIGVVLAMLLGMVSFATPALASAPQNYTVLVGAENTSMGVTLMGFYPHTVRIHVGDSVTWQINSHEPHTVTFLTGGSRGPLIFPGPLGFQVNSDAFFATPTNGLYDGSTYMNSGWMTLDPGFVQNFTLTFTAEGVFNYICYIHGEMMTGSVEVVGSDVAVLSPAGSQAQGLAELKADWLNVPTVFAQAKAQVVPPTKNSDGTSTHTITMGYESGNIAILQFFPDRQTVKPGDTVVWTMPSTIGEGAPHTVTFYNGIPDKPLFIEVQGPNGPVELVNPEVLFPSSAVLQGIPLNDTDYFNSGLMLQGTFSLKVGNISGTLDYDCVIHDTSGMHASLFVVPKGGK